MAKRSTDRHDDGNMPSPSPYFPDENQRALKRRFRAWFIPVAVTAIAAVALVAAQALWVLSQRDADRWEMTQRQLFSFKLNLSSWSVIHHKIPGPTLADAIRAMQNDELFSERFERMSNTCPLVLEGRDAWGRPLIYEVSPDGRTAVIRSMGSNGKDDHGSSDDIEDEVVLRCTD